MGVMETYKITMKISGTPSVIRDMIKELEEDYGTCGCFAAECAAEIEESGNTSVQTGVDIQYTDRSIVFIMSLTGEGEEFDGYINKLRNMILSGDLQRSMTKNGHDRLNIRCTAIFEKV